METKQTVCQWCEENVIFVDDKGHCLNKVDFVSGMECGMKPIDICLNFSNVDAYAVDKFVDFVPEIVMNTIETVTPDCNLINLITLSLHN